jgi:hypothetical protein
MVRIAIDPRGGETHFCMQNQAQLDSLAELKRLLISRVAGPIRDETIQQLLQSCWDLLGGSTQKGTLPEKLSGRMENLRWEPPHLLFEIERHGGTALGSSRAEIHQWRVDLEAEVAVCTTGRYRQLRRRIAPLDVKPLAEMIVRLIQSGEVSPTLKWVSGDVVKIAIGQIVPAGCAKQTLIGRRKRFKKALEPLLAQLGWHRKIGTSANTYQRGPTASTEHEPALKPKIRPMP